MYWNNPIVESRVNGLVDPVAESQHQGQHCLFYNPAVPITDLVQLVSLQDTCDLANHWLRRFDAVQEPGDIDKIANIVRVNQFVHSLQRHGNLKPILLYYTGSLPMTGGTGGSRVMAAERIPSITSLPAFISTHSDYRHQFRHLEEITSLAQFANHCHATNSTPFYFRLTDSNAAYGIDWYEAALETTSVPDNEQCLAWLTAYVDQQSSTFCFTPEWFDQLIDWTTVGHQAAKS